MPSDYASTTRACTSTCGSNNSSMSCCESDGVGGAARVCFRNPLLGHFPRHISLLFDASECSIVEKLARGNVGECECG